MDPEILKTLIITTIAGLSTVLGCLPLFLPNARSERTIVFALGFAAGIMIAVSFTDILPESLELLSAAMNKTGSAVAVMVICLFAGAVAAAAADKLIAHDHNNPDGDLFRTGMVSLIAIMLHKFPEGIAIFVAGSHDMTLGMTIAIAISLHNIPEGIAISMPIFHATGSRLQAIKYTFIASLAEPIGAVLALLVLTPYINDLILGGMFAMVAGIMLHVAFEELIPASQRYQYGKTSIYAILAGICIMSIASIIVH